MNASVLTHPENHAVSTDATLAAPAPATAFRPAVAASAAPSVTPPAARPRRRTIYAEGERQASLGRLTTRCPTILRDYLKSTACHPHSGYRSFTHMVTVALVEFLAQLPAPDDTSAKPAWAKGRGASEGTVLVHANTERLPSMGGNGGTTCVDGCALAEQAIAVAESHGVTMSAFTLTLLLWMAVKHPPTDAKMKRALVAAKKECFG